MFLDSLLYYQPDWQERERDTVIINSFSVIDFVVMIWGEIHKMRHIKSRI